MLLALTTELERKKQQKEDYLLNYFITDIINSPFQWKYYQGTKDRKRLLYLSSFKIKSILFSFYNWEGIYISSIEALTNILVLCEHK